MQLIILNHNRLSIFTDHWLKTAGRGVRRAVAIRQRSRGGKA
ncbi:MAG TPA: hypothetical protein PL105_18660 [Caldilineaceae bacterium]|nr:hypothetical protein [Caldilineaceae bacterium]